MPLPISFSTSEKERLGCFQVLSSSKEFGVVGIDEVRQLCDATQVAVDLLNDCDAKAILYSMKTEEDKNE